MRVSVIVPVYNTEAYVRQAVESALAQPETDEVILVEDGSTDNTLAVCQELAAEHPIVHLYRHPDGQNQGYPASLNLGILKSTCEYIAFLDADDFFLPGRFSVSRRLFEADPELEGVYEAVGRFVENEAAAKRWVGAGRPLDTIITMTERIPPEQLFTKFVQGRVGNFSSNGLVVKRTVFDKTGLYDEHLRLHQDTAMNIKMAAVAKLAPGRLDEPVAMARIHMGNRISAPRPQSEVYKTKMMFWNTVWHWSCENLDEVQQRIVLDRFLHRAMHVRRFDETRLKLPGGLRKRVQLALLLLDYPSLIGEPSLWQRFVPSPRYWGRCLQRRLAPKPQA